MLRGYTPQAALDAPRFCISAGSPETEDKESGNAGDINSEVYLEEGISEEVLVKLQGMNDELSVVTFLKPIVTLVTLQRWVMIRGERVGSRGAC